MQQAREDLQIGRAALALGLIDGPTLTRALLTQSATGMKKTLDAILVERGFLQPGQIELIKQGVEHFPAEEKEREPSEAAKARCGQVVALSVLCDSVLDEGRFKTIYLGRLPRDPEPVALTLISKEALRHGLWMDFLETVRACKNIRHPNVVDVIDVGMVPDAFAYVTRYSRGGILLRDLLQRVQRLKLSEALRIAKEMAQGLAALHEAGLAHRDLRPINVLLGRGGEVQIQNAGIVFEPKGAQDFSDRGSVFGTPHYMAPEALRGEGPNPQSDIYSLGVIAYQLVTGVRPFEGQGLTDLRPQHLEQAPIAPKEVMSALPKEVSDFLVWLLRKKPGERPTAPKAVTTLQSLLGSIQRTGHTQKFQAFDPNG